MERIDGGRGDAAEDDPGRGDAAGGDGTGRRALLAAGAAAAAGAVAGCTGFTDDGTGPAGPVSLADFRGSGANVGARPELEGPRIEDLPPLEGTLNVWIGGGEGGRYERLLDLLAGIYEDFRPNPRKAPAAQLSNSIIEASRGRGTPADVYWAVDAGSLAVVADAGATAELTGEEVGRVPENFRPSNQWVGVAGRARAIPYNTDRFSASDVPTDVFAFAEDSRFSGNMGWAPTYSAFQAFVTAMRLMAGRDRTAGWLRGMLDQDVTEYNDEFLTSNAVADGEIAAGFANHYYALRVRNDRSSAPLDLAFTENDPGALINTAAAGVMADSDRTSMARRFVRHLLTVEGQEFFATRSFAYPMIPGVPPVGGLPTIDELNPPDLDLSRLSEVEPTIDLLRDVGVL